MRAIFFLLFLLIGISVVGFAQDQPIILKTKTGNIYGSLLVPEKVKKPAVVLIISGSGPTDRDGNQSSLKNNSLKQLADSLYQRGIASLRFDKRAIAESKIENFDQRSLRFENYVADAKDWISLLAADKRFSKIIVAGHSEGALIGLMASLQNHNVKGYISIAGPSRPADEMIKEQLSEQPEMIRSAVFPMLDTLKMGDTLTTVPQYLMTLFNPSVQPYLISWMKYDPRKEIVKLKIPALIIQGTTDVQVLPKDAEMLGSAYPTATVKKIEGMNHVLKAFGSMDKREQITTYSDPTLPIHKDFVPAIFAFIKQLK